MCCVLLSLCFFFNDRATTEIYPYGHTLSLHDALPIVWWGPMRSPSDLADAFRSSGRKLTPQRERIFRVLHENPTHPTAEAVHAEVRSEEHTSELQSLMRTSYAVFCLKKKPKVIHEHANYSIF